MAGWLSAARSRHLGAGSGFLSHPSVSPSVGFTGPGVCRCRGRLWGTCGTARLPQPLGWPSGGCVCSPAAPVLAATAGRSSTGHLCVGTKPGEAQHGAGIRGVEPALAARGRDPRLGPFLCHLYPRVTSEALCFLQPCDRGHFLHAPPLTRFLRSLGVPLLKFNPLTSRFKPTSCKRF